MVISARSGRVEMVLLLFYSLMSALAARTLPSLAYSSRDRAAPLSWHADDEVEALGEERLAGSSPAELLLLVPVSNGVCIDASRTRPRSGAPADHATRARTAADLRSSPGCL